MQKDIMKDETITGYREGVVTKEALSDWNCHVTASNEKEVFRYIEIFCESGAHYYVYEDEQGYALFEKNFMSNRFTSYHEFWTTKELAVEERGALALKYYVRHPEEVYRFTPLATAREMLKEYEQLPPRITVLGKYDREEIDV